jgi:hypothetical protein
MKSSCCLTGAGVIAPKGTSLSLGTLMAITFLLSFSFMFHSVFTIPNSTL